MSNHIESIKEWVRSLRQDVRAVKAVVESDAADKQARKFAAAALNYLITRMDLVPDWNDTIGIIDDVLIARVCLNLASAYPLDEALDSDTFVTIGRMINDVDTIEAFLGADLFGKLRKHCTRLIHEPVRGRSPEAIVSDAKVRGDLFDDVEQDLSRMPAVSFDKPDDVTVRFKSYLHHKLK